MCPASGWKLSGEENTKIKTGYPEEALRGTCKMNWVLRVNGSKICWIQTSPELQLQVWSVEEKTNKLQTHFHKFLSFIQTSAQMKDVHRSVAKPAAACVTSSFAIRRLFFFPSLVNIFICQRFISSPRWFSVWTSLKHEPPRVILSCDWFVDTQIQFCVKEQLFYKCSLALLHWRPEQSKNPWCSPANKLRHGRDFWVTVWEIKILAATFGPTEAGQVCLLMN